MTRTTISVHFALIFAAFGLTLPTLAPAPANAQNQNMEVIHHPNYDKTCSCRSCPLSKSRAEKFYGWLALQRCRSITTIPISGMRSKSTWSMI